MDSLLDFVGNTPLVELTRINPNPKVKLLGKLEGHNPGGSVKDRAAYSMIKGAVERGEIKAGMPNHGEPANILWKAKHIDAHLFQMQVTSSKEGLHIERKILLDENDAVFHVTESVTNINTLGRLFNLVQHPTIATPFLNEHTIVNCNADKGFEYRNGDKAEQHLVQWSTVADDSNNEFDLRYSNHVFNSVYSFVVNPNEKYGWITSYSPAHQLIFGYVWLRKSFPWINLWQHFEEGKIKYRGLEFGTTGLHQSFQTIWKNNMFKVLGENTTVYIDAGEKISYQYACFLCEVKEEITGIKNVEIKDDRIILTTQNMQTLEAGSINYHES